MKLLKMIIRNEEMFNIKIFGVHGWTNELDLFQNKLIYENQGVFMFHENGISVPGAMSPENLKSLISLDDKILIKEVTI